jgi:quercetin dioxygenase-like cupin family protein
MTVDLAAAQCRDEATKSCSVAQVARKQVMNPWQQVQNRGERMMQGYVLRVTDGERMFNSSGEVVVKVDRNRSSNDLSLGTQLVPPGVGIPRHVHTCWDEVIYVLDGGGIVTLNDEQVPLQKGATIFIPKGVWHGFENPDTELFILWLAPAPGQAAFFRGISSRPGEPAKNLSREQVMAIREQVQTDHLKRVQSES